MLQAQEVVHGSKGPELALAKQAAGHSHSHSTPAHTAEITSLKLCCSRDETLPRYACTAIWQGCKWQPPGRAGAGHVGLAKSRETVDAATQLPCCSSATAVLCLHGHAVGIEKGLELWRAATWSSECRATSVNAVAMGPGSLQLCMAGLYAGGAAPQQPLPAHHNPDVDKEDDCGAAGGRVSRRRQVCATGILRWEPW